MDCGKTGFNRFGKGMSFWYRSLLVRSLLVPEFTGTAKPFTFCHSEPLQR